jgi:hypothetical protein
MTCNNLCTRSEYLRVFTFLRFFPAPFCWPLLQKLFFFPPWRKNSQWAKTFSLSRLHDQRHTTLGRTSLEKWSFRRRDHYLTTHNSHNRDIHAPSEPAVPARERPQTHALNHASGERGPKIYISGNYIHRSYRGDARQFLSRIERITGNKYAPPWEPRISPYHSA